MRLLIVLALASLLALTSSTAAVARLADNGTAAPEVGAPAAAVVAAAAAPTSAPVSDVRSSGLNYDQVRSAVAATPTSAPVSDVRSSGLNYDQVRSAASDAAGGSSGDGLGTIAIIALCAAGLAAAASFAYAGARVERHHRAVLH